MFCPKCSQQQPAEDLRFCPRCGFPLRDVRGPVAREEARGDGGVEQTVEEGALPAQKYLTTGALLMFVGCVVAVLWDFMGTRGPAEVALPQSYFIMGGTLAFVLTFLHPLLRWLEGLTTGGPAADSRRRGDGINLGCVAEHTCKRLHALARRHRRTGGPAERRRRDHAKAERLSWFRHAGARSHGRAVKCEWKGREGGRVRVGRFFPAPLLFV